MRLLPITQLLFLPTRRLLLSSSGPDSLPTHSRSSATSELEWRLQWGILMCFQILSLLVLWRASGPSITLCRRCRFRGGGGGVIVHTRIKVFFVFFCHLYIFRYFYDTLADMVVICLHLGLCVIL